MHRKAEEGGARDDGSATVERDGKQIGGRFFGQSSFAAHAIADQRSVVKVDDDAPLELLAPLGCGVQTGFGTVWSILEPAPGSTPAVFEAGAVGLATVTSAAALPLQAVIAEITGGRGLGSAIDTTAVPGVIRAAVDALGIRGTCAIVGAPAQGTEVSFEVQSLLPGMRIVGVTLGDGEPETLLPQLVSLHRASKLPLKKLVRHYALEDLDTAAHDMHTGATIKPVVRLAD